jgi:hypothetical protein
MDHTPTISGSPSSRRGDHATHGKIGHRLPPSRARDSCVSGDDIVRNMSARISGRTSPRSRPTAAATTEPATPRTSAPHHQPPAATTNPLLMQWTGTLADETSPELVGSWANTRDSDIASRRRRPIRSLHAAVAHCWADGNSEMCLPVRRQYRGGAVRRSRVAQRRCGVARQCSPVSLAPRSTKRGN